MRRSLIILPTLAAAIALSGCTASSSGKWPSLAEGFQAAPTQAAQPAPGAAAKAESPDSIPGTPVPLQAAAVDRKLKALAAHLRQFETEFAANRRTVGELDNAFKTAMAAFQSDRTPDNWHGAQIALTRYDMIASDLSTLNSRLADTLAGAVELYASLQNADSRTPANLETATRLLARGGELYGRIRRTQQTDTVLTLTRASELALLRPGATGARMRQDVLADFAGRQALLTIRFETASPAFEDGLAKVVEAARAQVPDVRFDLLVTHAPADSARAEAALRTALTALLELGVTPEQVVRRPDSEARAPLVQLYVR